MRAVPDKAASDEDIDPLAHYPGWLDFLYFIDLRS